MFDPSAVFYMDKIAVGPEAADVIDLAAGVAENIRRVAKAKNRAVSDTTVTILTVRGTPTSSARSARRAPASG